MSESPPNESTTGETRTDSRTRTQGEPDGQKWLSGLVSLIGLWIAAAPFVYESTASATWNNVLAGGAIFLLAGYNYYRIVNVRSTSAGAMGLVALLGLWTFVSPYVLEWAIEGEVVTEGLAIAQQAFVWNDVISGIVTAILAAYVAYTAGTDVRARTAAQVR